MLAIESRRQTVCVAATGDFISPPGVIKTIVCQTFTGSQNDCLQYFNDEMFINWKMYYNHNFDMLMMRIKTTFNFIIRFKISSPSLKYEFNGRWWMECCWNQAKSTVVNRLLSAEIYFPLLGIHSIRFCLKVLSVLVMTHKFCYWYWVKEAEYVVLSRYLHKYISRYECFGVKMKIWRKKGKIIQSMFGCFLRSHEPREVLTWIDQCWICIKQRGVKSGSNLHDWL